MYRSLAITLGVLAVFAVGACTDTPTGGSKSPAAGSGEGGISRNSAEQAETKPAPAVEEGVVPDVLGVALEDAEMAVEDAGFTSKVEGGGTFNVFPSFIPICEQDPAGGAEPPKNSEVLLIAERACQI